MADKAEAVLESADLPELLAELAEAASFTEAGERLLGRFAAAAGASRATLVVLDRESLSLQPAVSLGAEQEEQHAVPAIPLERDGHPLTAASLAQVVVLCDEPGARRAGLSYSRACIVPLPQPQARGLPTLLPESSDPPPLGPGCRVFSWPGGRRRRLGQAPFGAVILESEPGDDVIVSLAIAALVVGPILSRTHAVDRLQRSAERLDEQRALLSTVLNALPDPIVITDQDSRVVVQNSRTELLFTSREGDSEGRRRAVEINTLLFTSFASRAVLSGAASRGARELNLVDPDEGTDLLFEVLTHELPSGMTHAGAHLSVLREVTDLKRASLELEQQFRRVRLAEVEASRERDRLNLILNNVGDPIVVTDGASNVILMNPQAEALFEMPHSPGDRTQAQRVRGNDTRFTTLISDFAISGARERREQTTLIQPTTGLELPVEVIAGKVLNERGEPIAIVSVLHDLTRQVENERLYEELKGFSAELEGRIRLATADLEAQNLRLQWQSAELEKAYRLKSEFLANMSHELRTPINALIGYTSLMLDRIYGELTAKQVEGLTRIQASSHHLLELINDILDLARIEAGKMPVHLEPVSIRPIITEVTAQIEPLMRRKALHFACEMDSGIPIMLTDRTKVKQILINLLSNAVKFTHEGSVRLEVRRRDGELQLVVGDTGIGIRPEHLEVIFEEFRQVDQSRTREYGGTGLGLSITRKLIALLGGEVRVESDYGAGATFTVVLPLRSEALSIDEQVARAVLPDVATHG